MSAQRYPPGRKAGCRLGQSVSRARLGSSNANSPIHLVLLPPAHRLAPPIHANPLQHPPFSDTRVPRVLDSGERSLVQGDKAEELHIGPGLGLLLRVAKEPRVAACAGVGDCWGV